MDRLAFEEVGLAYGGADGVRALEGVSFSVGAGESLAILGPSGCGKSSMLRMACGLMRPTSGRVLADGAPVAGPGLATALILQDFGLLPWRNVLENAGMGLKVRRIPKRERERRAREALELVGLAGFSQAYPADLSGGMKQRLAIARALALDVSLLLMDEPLSALDSLLREQMQDMLLDLWKKEGYAQVVVTHSIEEAAFLGQRIVVMTPRPGRVSRIVANPGQGAPGFRSAEAFHGTCDALRRALEEGVAHA